MKTRTKKTETEAKLRAERDRLLQKSNELNQQRIALEKECWALGLASDPDFVKDREDFDCDVAELLKR